MPDCPASRAPPNWSPISATPNFDTVHLPFERDDDIASFYETTRRRAVDKAVLWIERAGHLGVRAVIQHPTTC